jgi:hypothetical protein
MTTNSPQYKETALLFAQQGSIPEHAARQLLEQPLEQRQQLQTELVNAGDQLSEPEHQRLNWLCSQLGRNPVNETVFVRYATSIALMGRRADEITEFHAENSTLAFNVNRRSH